MQIYLTGVHDLWVNSYNSKETALMWGSLWNAEARIDNMGAACTRGIQKEEITYSNGIRF